MECQRAECKREATHVPIVLIPARYVPESILSPVKVIIPLPLCNRCVNETTVQEFLNDTVKKQVESMCRHKQAVAFENARISKMKVTEQDVKNLLSIFPAGGSPYAEPTDNE